jgi:hypothetical protein
MVAKVRKLVEEKYSIPGHAVLLNAAHTHGGPNVRGFNTMGERDRAYIDVLVRKIAGAIKQAADRLEPASLAFGRAPVQIGVNRRQYPKSEGLTTIGQNPAGPVDTRVRTLVVRDSRRRPKALLFHHACHPTTVGGDNLLITADFPGVACSLIWDRTGGEVMPFFLQGCCGNVNPQPRGSFEYVAQHGTALGEAALEAMSKAEPNTASPLDVEERTIELPLIAPPAPAKIQESIDEWEAKARELMHADRPGHLMHAEGMVDYFRKELEIVERGMSALTSAFAIQRLRIGELQILGMPAEMFVQYQLDFEQQAEGPVMALGFTNGVHGYMPVAADYPYGGYEVDGAHRYYGTLMYTPECEQLIRREAYDLLGIHNPDYAEYQTE